MFDKTKAIVDLLLEKPFFGVVLSHTHVVESSSRTQTMGTDGKTIYYNPKWSEKLTPSEQRAVLAHEVLHIVLGHHIRMKGRNALVWNIACDMAINPLLDNEGFMLPVNVVRDNVIPPRTAEEIYEELEKTGILSTYVPWGEVIEPEEGSGAKEEDRVTALSAQAYSQGISRMSESLKRTVGNYMTPPTHWSDLLRNFLSQTAKDCYCYTRFNKRWIRSGIYLPALYSPILNLVIAVDTSGSVDEEEISTMVSTVNDIKTQIRSTVRVIYCDDKVCKEEFFDIDENASLNPSGGGGTDYRPVFKYLDNVEDISVLIYLTDGLCDLYPNKDTIEYPVMWVYIQNGKDIKIDIW